MLASRMLCWLVADHIGKWGTPLTTGGALLVNGMLQLLVNHHVGYWDSALASGALRCLVLCFIDLWSPLLARGVFCWPVDDSAGYWARGWA